MHESHHPHAPNRVTKCGARLNDPCPHGLGSTPFTATRPAGHSSVRHLFADHFRLRPRGCTHSGKT